MNERSQSDFTKHYLELAGLPESDFITIRNKIWFSPSLERSLRLRPYGVMFLEHVVKIPVCTIKLNPKTVYSKHIVLLDRTFTTPYCLLDNFTADARITVVDSTVATMLLLMDGNLSQYLENNS